MQFEDGACDLSRLDEQPRVRPKTAVPTIIFGALTETLAVRRMYG